MAENRRIQNIDRFVVEPFVNRASKVFVWINDQRNWTSVAWGTRQEEEANETRGREYHSEIMNCAPSNLTMSRMSICHQSAAQCQPFNPFRAVNDLRSPIIGDFWVQVGVSGKALLDLLGLV